MRDNKKFFQSTPNRSFSGSEAPDTSSFITAAITEHLKWHQNDGCPLFVFGAQFQNISRQAIIPVSVPDSATAFAVAQTAIKECKYPEQPEWFLLYEYTPHRL
jgi:hypothetical protein